MGANWWVLIGQLLVLAGVIVTVVWGARHQRKQPVVDEATAQHTDVDANRLRQTIEQMNEQSNQRRDIRLAQFHGFLLLDAEWHLTVMANERSMIATIRELTTLVKNLGGDVSQVAIPRSSPPPPPVPEPPAIPVA